MKTVASHRVHGGQLSIVEHMANSTSCPMRFSIFIPAGEGPFSTLLWLSGLTCTEDNFTTKAGAYQKAAALNLIVVAPDTSPRGDGVPDDPDGAYDFGLGAGFYLNATQAPWSTHYQMARYISEELPALLRDTFPVAPGGFGLLGHSMGGHGALTLGLTHPSLFKSLSAFAPIVAPSEVPWGEKAFTGYLGEDRSAWSAYDACALMRKAGDRSTAAPILIDQGLDDPFLKEQLKPELFEAACAEANQALTLRMHPGYDHSYFFITSFIDDHLDHHARLLNG